MGNSVALDVLTAAGGGGTGTHSSGGVGRIAIYSPNTVNYTSSNPTPNIINPLLTYTPTPTPSSATPTATPTAPAAIPAGWVERQYIYAGSQPHAVDAIQQAAGNDSFTYDANGNMITRVENGVTWVQLFNSENRLASITNTTADPDQTWTFTYDGDGNRIKQIYNDGQTSTVTLFLGGGIYMVVNPGANQVITKYYAIAGQRVAMENGDGLQYLLTDHLGSVSAVLDATGDLLSEQRYLPFGAERLTPDILQTDFGFTGQRDLAAAGLMDYNARWFNANVGAFTQPDTIVPAPMNPQSLNRFSYTYNNPINFIDPSGHEIDTYGGDDCGRKYQAGGDCKIWQGPIYDPRIGPNYGRILYNLYQKKPLEQLLYDIEEALPTGAGIRLEGSYTAPGAPVSQDINIDLIYLPRSNQVDLMITPGAFTAVGAGGGPSVGGLAIFNMDDASQYKGPFWTPAGASLPVVLEPLSIETDFSHSFTLNSDGTLPGVVYVGVGPAKPEVVFYQGPSVTFSIGDLVKSGLEFLDSWFQ